MVHVKAEQINQADVDGIAEVMRHGKRKHVIARGNPEVRGSDKKKEKKNKKKMVSRCKLHHGVL